MNRKIGLLVMLTISAIAAVLTGCATTNAMEQPPEINYDSLLDSFTVSKAQNGMKYAFYSPVKDSADTTRYPLVIYVHGLFHAWTDRSFKKSGLTWWACRDMQSKFKAGGAFLLMPKIPETAKTEKQSEKVFAVIKEFMAANPDSIDTDRIYVMGGSAGGYIAWQLVLEHPDFFTAGVMIAANRKVTADEVATVRDMPVWMVSCKTDPLVNFDNYQQPTWENVQTGSTVPDMCRWTVFDDQVTVPDGSHPAVTHFLAKTIGYNFCTISDRKPFEGMTTIDGKGNTITLSWNNSLTEWLEICAEQ